jgi:UDP-glucuronate 4-epimerase
VAVKICVTGAAGFIGMSLSARLLKDGHQVVAIDSLNPSYGGTWSKQRAVQLNEEFNLQTRELDLTSCEKNELIHLMKDCEVIIHLAAWPGVRQGQIQPGLYSQNNIHAFSKILEVVRTIKPMHFLYASSSSVYGDLASNGSVSEASATGNNLKSYYAATKWMNEIEARATQELVNFPMTALRFFTVYGPWGRPDMAYWTFIEKIKSKQEIELYGETGGSRNFTFVSDAVEIVSSLIQKSLPPLHRPLNIAIGQPIETLRFLNLLSDRLGLKPSIKIVERPKVDVEKTWADLSEIRKLINLPNQTDLSSGIDQFVSWYEKIKA